MQVLTACSPEVKQRNSLIRHLKAYGAGLARFLIKPPLIHLHNFQRRSSPWDGSGQVWTIDFCDTVRHVLRLADKHESAEDDVHFFTDRAALLVIHAALLVQLHAKAITGFQSQGIVDLDCPDNSVDSYTDRDSFLQVARASREAGEAVRNLYAAGEDLCDSVCWFLCEKSLATYVSSQRRHRNSERRSSKGVPGSERRFSRLGLEGN